MSVQLAILGFLYEREYHGYELKKLITRRMGMWTDIKFGSIYYALKVLEESGFIRKVSRLSQGTRPARSVYGITEEGRKEFLRLIKENILYLQRIYLKDDIGIYFGDRVSRREFLDILDQKRRLLEGIYCQLRDHFDNVERIIASRCELARQLISRHLRHLEVEIHWFQEIAQAVKEGRIYPKWSANLKRKAKSQLPVSDGGGYEND